MNKQIILTLLLCLTMVGLARGGSGGEATQTAFLSGEKLNWQVVTASGGSASGGGFKLSSSLGQTAVGKSTSASFHLINGFLQSFGATVAPCPRCGDANNDGAKDISDVVLLIAYIFAGGAAPGECNGPRGLGDADGGGYVDISDVVYLIAYIFAGGRAPHCP
jgi:hypothetical protein